MKHNQPAFPVLGLRKTASGDITNEPTIFEGITTREHFASLAMQGLLASLSEEEVQLGNAVKQIALASVAYADALIAEINKKS